MRKSGPAQFFLKKRLTNEKVFDIIGLSKEREIKKMDVATNQKLVEKTLEEFYNRIEEEELALERKFELWGSLAVREDELTYDDVCCALSWLNHSTKSADEIIEIVLDNKE